MKNMLASTGIETNDYTSSPYRSFTKIKANLMSNMSYIDPSTRTQSQISHKIRNR